MSVANSSEQEAEFDYELLVEDRQPFWVRYRTIILLAAILIVAAFFRFYGRDFDQGTNQHPDERAIVDRTININWPSSLNQLFNAQTSPMNLRSFGRYPWGALPVYIQRAAAWVTDQVVGVVKPELKDYYLHDYHGAQQLGRTMASIFDLITILLVFLIGRRLYSSKVGLIAAAIVAFSVTNIQIAHFYITEPFLVTFMMAALYFSVRLMQKPSWWAAAAAGVFVGFSVGSKVTSALIFLMIIAAIFLRAAYRKHTRKLASELDDPVGMVPASAKERSLTFGQHWRRGLRYVGIAALFAIIGFGISEPYALWQFDFSQFQARPDQPQTIQSAFQNLMESNPWGKVIVEEAATQSGNDAADIPYTRQYVGTVPVLYQFEQLVFWGVGVIPGLVMVAGILLALWLAIKRRPAEVILLACGIPYFATILIGETKWMRYMLPLVPIFAILAGALLVRGASWAAARWPRSANERRFTVRAVQRRFFPVLTGAALVFGFLWAVAYMNIYSQDESRVQAAKWVNENLPAGATISHEGWDDDLPGLQGVVGGDPYRFDLYDDRAIDDELNYIKGMMSKTDFIDINSNRLYGSIPRLPWRYPVQIRFYQLLFAEKLGYVRVHTEHIMPELFGIQFDDQLADESFTVYDHPRVDIFKKVSTLTDDQLRSLFSTALNFPLEEYSTARHAKINGDKSLMYQQPIADQPEVGDYSWNPLAQEKTEWIGVALWILAVYVLGFAAMPIVFTVMRRLPDRGYAFAKLAGLLIVSWIVWMFASAHLVPFTVWSVYLGLALLIAFSVLLWKLGARHEILDFIRRKGRLIIFYEGIFLLAFVAMLIVRMLNPDVWHTVFGGEKTMEMGFLNATLRSPWMPPADPFFAGGYTNYYYQGQFIIACLIKMIGVDPAIAFNLGLSIIYALTFLAAASIVYNVVAWSRARRGGTHEVSNVGMAFAVLGGVMMMVLGNLSTIAQFIWVIFPGTADTLQAWGRNLGFSVEGLAFGARPDFYFWPPSRVIPNTINEFPYWSFLYGDLHPHLIDMPFTLLAAAIGVNMALAGRYMVSLADTGASRFADLRARVLSALQWQWGIGGAGVLSFAFSALALGVLFVANSWDFPTYVGLLGGATFVALLLSRKVAPTDGEGRVLEAPAQDNPLGTRGALTFAITAFAAVGVVAGLSVLAYLPFFLNFKAFFTKIMPLVDGGLIPGTNAVMHRTTIWEFIAVWGIFLFVAVSYLVVRLWHFPWRAALADLLGFVPMDRQPAARTTNVPAGTMAYEKVSEPFNSRFFPVRRQRRLDLAPAYLGGASSSSISTSTYFRTESHADDSIGETSTVEAAETIPDENGHPSLDSLPAPEQVEAAGLEQAYPAETVGDATDGARAATEAEDPISVPDVAETHALEAHTPAEDVGTNGHVEANVLTSQVVVPNWLADAHTEDQRQRVVVARPQGYQPGVIPLWAGFAILVGTAALTAVQVGTGQPVLALLIALIGGLIGTLLSTTRSAAALGGGLLMVTGLLVALGVEVVYLADHNAGGDYYRMNTVFKFYVQVWALLAIGGTIAVYYLLYGLRDGTEPKQGQAAELKEADDVDALDSQLDYSSLVQVDNPAEDLHPNGASGANGHESGQPTIPLGSSHPTTNWLVWSAEEVASTDLPTVSIAETDIDSLASAQEQSSDNSSNEFVAPLVPRPLKSLVENPELLSATPALVETLPEPLPERPEDLLKLRWTAGRVAWGAVALVFLLIGFIFPIYGTPSKLKERIQPDTPIGTLSGLSYMQNAVFSTDVAPFPIQMKYDYEGINWLNSNVKGLATIAELPIGYYREGGMRVASNTGLPMVIGGLHQEEQRADVYARLVGDRQGDMNDLFSSPDIQKTLTLISKYDIDYIYFGQLEQARAQQANALNSVRNKFDQMADPKIGILDKVFDTNTPEGVLGTVIYHVTRAKDKDPRTLVGSPVEGSGLPGISITPLPTSTPVPPPTPPVDDPELKALIQQVTADPTNRDKRAKLVEWYRDHGFPLEAAKELEILVQQDPTNVALRHQLGDAYNQAGMPDQALKAWEDARDVAPNNPDAHNKVGIAYMERKRYDDALREFQAAVDNNAAFVEAWFHMGEVYERKGDRDGARRSYQGVIDNSHEDNGWKAEAQKRLDALR